MAQIACSYQQGLHEVFVATPEPSSGPLLICGQPAQALLLRASPPSSRCATIPLLRHYTEVRHTRHAMPVGALTAWGTHSGRDWAPPRLVSHAGQGVPASRGEPAWKQPVTLRNWNCALSIRSNGV